MKPLAQTLTHLDVNLGDLCNLRCLACECWLKPGPVRLTPDLLAARISEAMAYIQGECGQFDKVMFIGGEPFTHLGLERWLKEQTLSLYLTIYTNFSTQAFAGGWPDNVHFLTSLDAATGETYQAIRRRDRYLITRENIRRNAPWIIHVDTTVSKANLPELADILAITEPVGCSHWFLPIDPRIVRFRNRVRDGREAGFNANRMKRLHQAVAGLEAILLDDESLEAVRRFFADHFQIKRINDFAMFKGIYLSSKRHFRDLEGFDESAPLAAIPSIDHTNCPGLVGYMEIGFDARGRFVPLVHCDRLRDRFGEKEAPAFETFAELFAWEAEVRSTVRCAVFCGRTQFLGIDNYMERFADVEALARGPK